MTTADDAFGTAAAVRRGSLSPREAVETAIDRIRQTDPEVNAVVAERFEAALTEASGTLPDGPLRGVPVLVKDLGVQVQGLAYTAGSKLFTGVVPRRDSLIAQRLRSAGAIILGAVNTPEFGRLMTTEPALHGPTRNPWNPAYSAGGSSGGSAAAVAAGMVPIAHASDAGGSIRLPASMCGVFGLKPSRGRVPADLPSVFASLLSVHHGVTRTVRDSALLLDVLSQPLPGDMFTFSSPGAGFEASLNRPAPRLRIAFSSEPLGPEPVPAEIRTSVEQVAQLCADLGHEVVEARPDYELSEAFGIARAIFGAGLSATLEKRSAELGRPIREDDVEPYTWLAYQQAREVSAADLLESMDGVQQLSWRVGEFFAAYDVLLTPTLGRHLPLIGQLDGSRIDEILAEAAGFWQFTGAYNVTGQPAASVPFGLDADGLPIGIQLVSRMGAEELLLRLAAQLEEAAPWPGGPS